MAVLVINAGSSSLKVAAFDRNLAPIAAARVTEIGGDARLEEAGTSTPVPAPDYTAAMAAVLAALDRAGVPLSRVTVAGHRVVHGGPHLAAPCRLTPDTIAQVEAAVPLAPLHNPPALLAIRALANLAPDLPQTASFDTAFHQTNPAIARRYALPEKAEALGIIRYGFHGISYASLVARLPALAGGPLPERLLAFHMGNGVSACAILNGRSVATTMGYSPLDGLTMGTRAGAIDGNAVLRLAEAFGIDGAKHLLNRESGLLGLGGASDMRALHAAGTEAARFAVDHFIYWATRHAGSLVAAMGGLDAIAFTGGIGENDPAIRAGICAGLSYMGAAVDPAANRAGAARLHAPESTVTIWIVPAAEESQIAFDAVGLLGEG